MVKKILFIAFIILFAGCSAPQLGKDIIVNIDRSTVKLENSKMDIALELLALVGAPIEHTTVEISADLKITNKWHSDIVLKKLTYSLVCEKDTLATGTAKINNVDGVIIPSDSIQKIPLKLFIDPKNISASKTISRTIKQKEMFIHGEVIASAYGKDFTYSFVKSTKELTKQQQIVQR